MSHQSLDGGAKSEQGYKNQAIYAEGDIVAASAVLLIRPTSIR
jgi:hypothetical protein